ncbi:unnamed protein product, partial [Mesorhabditis spiculigera]
MLQNFEKVMAFSPSSVSEECDGAKREDKVCRVCGDKAIGYNFGIVACESCKSFFRRQGTKAETLSCPFSGHCEINTQSRRYCQACRLRKCFEMGMSTEALRKCEREPGPSHSRKRQKEQPGKEPEDSNDSPDEVTIPREVFQELIRKSKAGEKITECICQCKCGFYPKGTKLVARETDKLPSNERCLEYKPVQPFSPAYFPMSPQTGLGNGHMSAIPAPAQSLYLAGQLPQGIDLSWYSPKLMAGIARMPPPLVVQPASMPTQLAPSPTIVAAHGSSPINTTPLNIVPVRAPIDTPESIAAVLEPELRGKLLELIRANECLKAPLEIEMEREMSLMEVVNITNLALRRIIVMAKELGAFKALSNADQVNLIKAGAGELLILRGVMVFDASKNVWNHPKQGSSDMQVKLDILLRSPVAQQHYEEHKRFLNSFGERIRQNETVMLCLAAVVLFSPDRPFLRDPQIISASRQQYTQLLRKVLDIAFPVPGESQTAFESLLQRVHDLRKISEGLLGVYCRLDPNQLDPLLLELFDLKQLPRGPDI